jgi:hypothetical protein
MRFTGSGFRLELRGICLLPGAALQPTGHEEGSDAVKPVALIGFRGLRLPCGPRIFPYF